MKFTGEKKVLPITVLISLHQPNLTLRAYDNCLDTEKKNQQQQHHHYASSIIAILFSTLCSNFIKKQTLQILKDSTFEFPLQSMNLFLQHCFEICQLKF